MKLTVWIATQNRDNHVYNIVARTKKEALALIAADPFTQYEPPRKTEIFYKNAFDLFYMTTSEGGGRHIHY
jgi:hypothetical protein